MTKIEEIKKEYLEFQKKHKLPDFSLLDEYFEIRAIDLEKGDLLNSIVRAILNKLGTFTDYLYSAINPNTNSIYSIELYNNLNEEEKRSVLEFYYEIIPHQLEAALALAGKAKDKVDYINKMYSNYPEIKARFTESLILFNETWKNIIKKESKRGKKGLLG